MTRRKSVCLKWTLVLLVVLVCPFVHSRPQDAVTDSDQNDKATQTPIRYRYTHNNLSSFKLAPTVITFVDQTRGGEGRNVKNVTVNSTFFQTTQTGNPSNFTSKNLESNDRNVTTNRVGRLIHSSRRGSVNKLKTKPNKNRNQATSTELRKKPAIRRVITKWRDKTKYDDLNFAYESTTVPNKPITKSGSDNNDKSSTESSEEINSKRYTLPYTGLHYNMHNKPRPQYSEEIHHVHSTNIQILDGNNHPYPHNYYPNPTRPSHFYTNIPTPTPVITNVGYPQPWTQTVRKTTTPRTKPTKYEYHNNINNHGGNYEVTTFEPSSSYTDRIIIRPEEYSPSAEDCPTIYLTLNNTFQGEGKEACPDLNIAVNTNVINKNVVVESEEDGDSLFPGFGLGLGDDSEQNGGDDSGTDSSKDEDYFESDENNEQADSASVEGTELVNYHSVNSPIQAQSSETNSFGGAAAASSPISALSRPSRPSSGDDDLFSFSSLVDFFRPALNALGWLTTINPLSIGLFPLLLAPFGFFFAGSGFATLFSPWILPIGREAPKIIHVYRPEWRWDNHLKTWQLHSFPNNRRLVPEIGRASVETKGEGFSMPTLISRLKSWIVDLTVKLKKSNNHPTTNQRKIRRRKRETWTRRVK